MTSPLTIRLGTRSSPLARWQADWVASELTARGVRVEMVPITTTGDRAVGSLASFGGVGVFTKEIQRALLDRRIDLAVHSLKDLPTEPVEGLVLAAVPPRESTRDALLSRDDKPLLELSNGARVGTGSTRRKAAILAARPDLVVEDIRGNVDTRLRKLAEGEYDAIVLAEAGLSRLGLADKITQLLPRELILPAVGQGALGLEARTDDANVRAALLPLNDPATHSAVLAERAMLFALRAGCLAPVGAWGRVEADGRLRLCAAVMSLDGQRVARADRLATAGAAVALGQQVAGELLAGGAAELIATARQ